MKAAILLLSGIIFFSQASLAGPPGATDCPLAASDPVHACTTELISTYFLLAEKYADDAFTSKNNATSNFFSLRCKVAFSEVKMSEDKPANAAKKLYASWIKVQDLDNQDKLESVAAAELASSFYEAWACADAEANK